MGDDDAGHDGQSAASTGPDAVGDGTAPRPKAAAPPGELDLGDDERVLPAAEPGATMPSTELDVGADGWTSPPAESETPEPETSASETPEPTALAKQDATGPLGNLVAAHFQRVEVAMLGRILTTTLGGALPASMVKVERRRSLFDRLRGRAGVVIGVGVAYGDQLLTFRSAGIGETQASVGHLVGGVVLSTRTVPVAEWLTLLGQMLEHATAEDASARLALERALAT